MPTMSYQFVIRSPTNMITSGSCRHTWVYTAMTSVGASHDKLLSDSLGTEGIPSKVKGETTVWLSVFRVALFLYLNGAFTLPGLWYSRQHSLHPKGCWWKGLFSVVSSFISGRAEDYSTSNHPGGHTKDCCYEDHPAFLAGNGAIIELSIGS